MHIMLFGASFDPPHNGHELIAKTVINQQIADEIWFVPCSIHAFAKPLSPNHHRLHMLELISLPHTRIETFELNKNGISYSYDTLKHFQMLQPENSFSWILGSDLLADFSKWYRYEDILKEFTVYVYPRPHFPFQPLYPGMVPLTDVSEIEAYSTEIREKIKQGKSINGLVNSKIEAYIKSHSLYNQ